ncbi:MAG: hypothetical protein CMQ05_09075 [Gammaproteobacteria bacterium]|nr:hypothetical protein [Gammaproteobacteria bacterium]
MELNSKGYWDARFSSGDWQSRGGALKEKAVQRICITGLMRSRSILNTYAATRRDTLKLYCQGLRSTYFWQSTGLSMVDVISIYISRIWAEVYVANLYDHARCRLCSDLT